MRTVTTTAPAKVILCGDHGVNRAQPALATAVDMPTLFKTRIDELQTGGDLDGIREEARAFFAPTRYVLAHLIDAVPMPGLTIEWRSTVPVSSGLGSGAAATSAMALGVLTLAGKTPTSRELIDFAWQGDVIAHGGIASALDSSTIVYGGLVSYAVDTGASPFCVSASLPLVIGNTHVADRSTAKLNTRVRKWLEGHPAKRHLFPDMGYLVDGIAHALKDNDLETLGHLLKDDFRAPDNIRTSWELRLRKTRHLSRRPSGRVRWVPRSRAPVAGASSLRSLVRGVRIRSPRR